jgi:hypothetical protein
MGYALNYLVSLVVDIPYISAISHVSVPSGEATKRTCGNNPNPVDRDKGIAAYSCSRTLQQLRGVGPSDFSQDGESTLQPASLTNQLKILGRMHQAVPEDSEK